MHRCVFQQHPSYSNNYYLKKNSAFNTPRMPAIYFLLDKIRNRQNKVVCDCVTIKEGNLINHS